MCHIALKIPRCAVPVGGLAKRHNAGFPGAEVLDDPLYRAVLAACVTPLEYQQHLVIVLDDVFLNLDELDLEIAQSCLVSCAAVLFATRLYALRHLASRSPKTLLLTAVAGELQQEDEQVEEIEVERKRTHDRLLGGNCRIVTRQVDLLDTLCVVGRKSDEHKDPDH